MQLAGRVKRTRGCLKLTDPVDSVDDIMAYRGLLAHSVDILLSKQEPSALVHPVHKEQAAPAGSVVFAWLSR